MSDNELFERRVGTRIKNKWTLERLLGVGGMAAVYVGVHTIGRREAIKILHPEVAADADLRARFEQEGQAVNRFKHPGVVDIVDIDVTDDGQPFLVMELLDGSSLETLLEQGHVPSFDTLMRLTDELLDVLAAAHAQGIIHRDIKPDNLFILRTGKLKVLDFGIARVRGAATPAKAPTRTGTTIGTMVYMPPEQVMGRSDLDARADLWAVGATLFRVLAGRHVHEAEGQFELMMKAASEPAPPLASAAPGVPAEVALVVDRALAFDREHRYPDARTMQDDVRALLRRERPPYASALLGPSSQGAAAGAAVHALPTVVGAPAPAAPLSSGATAAPAGPQPGALTPSQVLGPTSYGAQSPAAYTPTQAFGQHEPQAAAAALGHATTVQAQHHSAPVEPRPAAGNAPAAAQGAEPLAAAAPSSGQIPPVSAERPPAKTPPRSLLAVAALMTLVVLGGLLLVVRSLTGTSSQSTPEPPPASSSDAGAAGSGADDAGAPDAGGPTAGTATGPVPIKIGGGTTAGNHPPPLTTMPFPVRLVPGTIDTSDHDKGDKKGKKGKH